MCGIFAYLLRNGQKITEELRRLLNNNGMLIQHRGPDETVEYIENSVYFLFHRLAINDLSEKGRQPMIRDYDGKPVIMICNGEIYNYKQLAQKYEIELEGHSDCEIIIPLYHKLGFPEMIKQLDGYFAITLYDFSSETMWCGRDPIGIRSMFIAVNDDAIGICSEMKGLHELFPFEDRLTGIDIEQFPPGTYWNSKDQMFEPYYTFDYTPIEDTEENYCKQIRKLLENAVEKRFMSDRPIGCLLSGGLDSSLISALVANKLREKGQVLNTFSIGLEGSTDLKYAKMVADHIKSNHHEIIVTEEELIGFLGEDIRQMETWDTTTIRASTPMFLLCKWIKENTDITVVFSGEGSDEASGSYLYFHNAPNAEEFQMETVRLLEDLCFYDVLRGDKSSAGAGLEIRVPFLDLEFLDYYMGIKPEFKMPKTYKIEKYLLRKAFDNGILPSEVLWRVKEAFSDGISKKEKSWYQIIQDYVNKRMTDHEFQQLKEEYHYQTPKTKEAMYFRKKFLEYYPEREYTIPYYWLPKWSGNIVDPSARVLKVYNA
jgi:asparagine synthase (glutamine-hydrolysing)